MLQFCPSPASLPQFQYRISSSERPHIQNDTVRWWARSPPPLHAEGICEGCLSLVEPAAAACVRGTPVTSRVGTGPMPVAPPQVTLHRKSAADPRVKLSISYALSQVRAGPVDFCQVHCHLPAAELQRVRWPPFACTTAHATQDTQLTTLYTTRQSAKLSRYERRVMDLVIETKHLPAVLAKSGEVPLSPDEIAKLIGRVFIQRWGRARAWAPSSATRADEDALAGGHQSCIRLQRSIRARNAGHGSPAALSLSLSRPAAGPRSTCCPALAASSTRRSGSGARRTATR